MAMYSMKKAGKGRVGVYDQEMSRRVLGDAALAADLRRAIDDPDGGLHLEYQPIVSLLDGTVTGCEALLRWTHPDHGPLPPAAFLEVAQQRGLGLDLDRWVMSAVASQLAEWSGAGFTVQANVNTSAAYLGEPSFVTEVLDLLTHHHVPGQLLTIEITEQSLVADVTLVSERLRELRRHGVRVALDDFGTGYSGLSYLQELPVDVLKLDKSFVRVDGAGVPDGPMLGVVVGLGHALGMQVLAEGIESSVQEDSLRALGCDLGQGWRWTQALRPDAFRGWVLEQEQPQVAGERHGVLTR